MAELKLGLKALAAGVEKIPDEYWQKLPPFRPKEKSSGRKSGGSRSRPKPRRNSTGTPLTHLKHGAAGVAAAGAAYEAEKVARDSHENNKNQDQDSDHGSNDRGHDRNSNYHKRRGDSSSSMQDPNQDQGGYNSYQPPRDGGYDSNYQSHNSQYDHGYQPNQYVPPGYGQGDVAKRASSSGPSGRHDRGRNYEQDDDSDDGWSRNKNSSRRDSRRTRSPNIDGLRGKVSKNLDLSEKGLGYGVLGAIAGGFIGHEFGKGPIATGVGAVVGGLGANVLEAREERHKLNARRERKYAAMRSRSEGRDRDRQYDSNSNQSYYNDSYYNNGRGDVGSDEEYEDRNSRNSRRQSSSRR